MASVAFGIQGSGQLVGGVPDPGLFREAAVRAEELGYDSIWAGDHISYRNPMLDVVVALSTFAAVTTRITIGAGVVLLPLRHPSVVAKEFASLDYVSGGRVILGMAGTPEECVSRVREYVDAGARHVVFNILEPADAERLMEVARAAAD